MRSQFLFVSWVIGVLLIIASIGPQKTMAGDDSPIYPSLAAGVVYPSVNLDIRRISGAPIGNNTIGSNQAICQNTSPAALSGSAPTGGNGSFGFQWQSSTVSASDGFSSIGGAGNQGYAPGALNQTHWYRRIVSSGTESDTSSAIQITVDPLPDVSIRYDGSPYCGTGTALVTLSGLAGGSFSASTGLSLDAVTGTVNLSASTPGTYTVNYSFNSGACTGTATTNIVVGDPLLVITNPLPVCGSPTADITSPAITEGSTSGLNFYYYTDNAGTQPVADPTAVTSSDTYYIRGISAGGCSTTVAPVVVVLNDLPVITTSDTVYSCKGLPVTLKASAAGSEINWQNIGKGDSVVVQPAANTIYKAIAINNAGCTDTAIVSVLLNDFSISLKVNPNPMLIGAPATFTTSASSAYEVLAWTPERYFSNQTANAQTLEINDTTSTYSVIAKSPEGCIDTASIKTTVDNQDFFIPNAFTPNNDGKNDLFRIYGSAVTGANIRIYNQWGVMIYETSDNTKGWDGTHKNHPQPVGLYVYVIKVRLANEDTFIKKGTIRLIR
ncbi:MAG TPA: gliding motility-associated C-terminal domain-containing protein [Agriterribacter sp.]|nr:gliding motility-associated C-terminal domain-containing protein [Agriterribacter sp.]